MEARIDRDSSLTRLWNEVRPRHHRERLLWWAAGVLMASAAVHAVIWLVSGEAWAGAVAWRKPIVFGWSFGVTLLSLAWVLRHLPPAPRLGWLLSGGLVLSALGEVGLITMQRWRGVASHFNAATAFDSAIFTAMGMMIGVFAGLTVIVLVWAVLLLRASGPVGIAAVAGLVFLFIGQALGAPLIAEGRAVTAATGGVPGHVTIGAAGVGKLPHGLGVHGLQAVGGLAVLLGAGSFIARRARRVMWTGVVGYALLLAWAITQTYLGRGPRDLTPALGAWLIGSLSIVVTAYAQALAGVGRPSLPRSRQRDISSAKPIPDTLAP